MQFLNSPKCLSLVFLLLTTSCAEPDAFKFDEEKTVASAKLSIASSVPTLVGAPAITEFNLSGACTWDQGSITITDFEPSTTCNAGTWEIQLDLSELEEGAHSLQIIEAHEEETNTLSFGITIDTTTPQIVTQSPINPVESEQSISVQLLFDESIVAPTTEELNLTNATVDSYSVMGQMIQLTINATDPGAVVVEFPEDSIKDLAGNIFTDTNPFSISYTYTP